MQKLVLAGLVFAALSAGAQSGEGFFKRPGTASGEGFFKRQGTASGEGFFKRAEAKDDYFKSINKPPVRSQTTKVEPARAKPTVVAQSTARDPNYSYPGDPDRQEIIKRLEDQQTLFNLRYQFPACDESTIECKEAMQRALDRLAGIKQNLEQAKSGGRVPIPNGKFVDYKLVSTDQLRNHIDFVKVQQAKRANVPCVGLKGPECDAKLMRNDEASAKLQRDLDNAKGWLASYGEDPNIGPREAQVKRLEAQMSDGKRTPTEKEALEKEIKDIRGKYSFASDEDRENQAERWPVYLEKQKLKAEYPECNKNSAACKAAYVDTVNAELDKSIEDFEKFKAGGEMGRVHSINMQRIDMMNHLENRQKYFEDSRETLKKSGMTDAMIDGNIAEAKRMINEQNKALEDYRRGRDELFYGKEIHGKKAADLIGQDLKIRQKDALISLGLSDNGTVYSLNAGKDKDCSISVHPASVPYELPGEDVAWRVEKVSPGLKFNKPEYVFEDGSPCVEKEKSKISAVWNSLRGAPEEKKKECLRKLAVGSMIDEGYETPKIYKCQDLPESNFVQKEIKKNCIVQAKTGQDYVMTPMSMDLVSGSGPDVKTMSFYASSDEKMLSCLRQYGLKQFPASPAAKVKPSTQPATTGQANAAR